MEASIIFHFAGRGIQGQRLSLLDFGQLLDPRWRAPHSHLEDEKPGASSGAASSLIHKFFHGSYNFALGGQ
jgi:solute carrier family 25 aspartate/glutamate transporter 12/13